MLITDPQTGAVNELEKGFLTYLNDSEQVEWFWENGTEVMQINFGIKYNNGLSTFQPDFLVKFTNGDVGIFDTKPINHNVEDTTVKAEALFEYLSITNKDRGDLPKVVGGIVVNKGGVYYYYNEEKYVDMDTDKETAGKNDLHVVLEKIETRDLNSAQREAVGDLQVQAIYDAYMTSGSKRISDFNGGTATVTVTVPLKSGQVGKGITVWYVANDGTRTSVPVSYSATEASFTVGHFSNYVVAYDPDKADMGFVDVPENAYYYDAVAWAVKNGITSGVDATHFAPEGSCTRAQMVTFIWRAAGSPEPTTTVNPFVDISAEKYYYKAVLWAAENGITKGTSDTEFSPNATVTRGQSVTFLCRALKGSAGSENPFKDVEEGNFYYDSVLWAVENGITNGTTEDLFSPKDDCLRGQIVTFLYRAYNK